VALAFNPFGTHFAVFLSAASRVPVTGRVRHRVEGFFAEPALRQAVDRLLDEPATAPEGER